MQKLIKFSQICIITVILWGVSQTALSGIRVSDHPPVSVRHQIDAPPFYHLLDNFNTGGTRECSSENGGFVLKPCPIIENMYVKFAYNTITPTSYAWLAVDLMGEDISDWDAIWIILRGTTGQEVLEAEFVTCGDEESSMEKISDHLIGGITKEWRGVTIPLDTFTDITDWSCMDRFTIRATHDIQSQSGEAHMDEVGLLASTVLIDDFHDQFFPNRFGGISGAWSDPPHPPIITPTFPDGVLQLDYDLTSPGVSGGYWTKLFSSNLLLQKDYLHFDVRGQQGGEEVSVQFIDCGTNGYLHRPEVKTTDYLDRGITTTWQTAIIPLVSFVEVLTDPDTGVDRRCTEQLAFNLVGRAPYTNDQGAIYFDNIMLKPASGFENPLWIDRFNDCDDWNAFSWKWYSRTLTSIPPPSPKLEMILDPDNRLGDYGCGLRLNFFVLTNQSAWVYTELKGLGVQDYTYLEFFIKGRDGGELTNVYLRDRYEKEFPVPITAADYWQLVSIPLHNFEENGVNLTNLSEVKFAFEEGVRIGEIYIDDMRFSVGPPIRFEHNSYLGIEKAGRISVSVVLDNISPKTVTVNYETHDGTAIAPDDYGATSGVLTFPPGDLKKHFEITISDDGITETREDLILTLSTPNNATLGSPNTAKVMLEDFYKTYLPLIITPDTGDLTLRNETGSVITLTLIHHDPMVVYASRTFSAVVGLYTWDNIPVGTYDWLVEAICDGNETQVGSQSPITIKKNQTVHIGKFFCGG